MTTYDVTFSGTRREMEAQASAEVKFYLGDKYAELIVGAKEVLTRPENSFTYNYRALRFQLAMFVGIQGRYPVRAIVRAAGKL